MKEQRNIRHLYYLLLLFGLFVCLDLNAQQNQDKQKDSLKQLIDKETVDSTQIDLYNQLGWLLAKEKSEKALEYAEKAEYLVNKIRDPYRADDVLRLKAFCYGNMNNRPKCLENHLKRVDLLQRINDKSIRLASAYYEAAAVFDSQGQDAAAEEYFEKCAKLSKEQGFKDVFGQVLLGLADFKIAREDFRGAKEDLKLGFNLLRKDKPEVAAVVLSSLSEVYLNQDSLDLSLTYLDTANIFLGSDPHPEYAGFVYQTYGKSFYAKSDFRSSVDYYNKARIQWESEQHKWYLQELYLLLARAYKEVNPDSANFFYEKHFELSEEVNTSNNNQKIAEMEARFKNHEKQKEIEILSKEKEISAIENKRQEQVNFLVSIGLIAVAVFSIFLVSRIRIIRKQNKLITQQKEEVTLQKEIVEEKSGEIMDSIIYAKRIQGATLPDTKKLEEQFSDSFVIYKPKDQLSGDYYWLGNINRPEQDLLDVVIVGDCTGHGVPGALLSILGLNYLNVGQSSNKLNSPAEILDFLNGGVHSTFRQTEGDIRDGMDIAVAALDRQNNKLYYACAKNPIYLIRNEEVIILKGDRHAIGKDSDSDKPQPFSNHEFDLLQGDLLFLFSDGYADQFGGSKGKKMGYKKFRQLLLKLRSGKMKAIGLELEQHFENWKNDNEQLDDVCVIGVRV